MINVDLLQYEENKLPINEWCKCQRRPLMIRPVESSSTADRIVRPAGCNCKILATSDGAGMQI